MKSLLVAVSKQNKTKYYRTKIHISVVVFDY